MLTESERSQRTFSVERLNESDIDAVADLYAKVFAIPPWNEYTRCKGCSKFFGLETKSGDSCPNCSGALKPAYPQDETISYIKKEIARPDAICLTIKESPLNGFAWGFSYGSPDDFAREKYQTEEMQTRIKSVLEENGITGRFFYFSECGIREEKRKSGLSNLLTEQLIQEAKRKDLPLVMRANCQSPMTAVAERFGFTQVMGPKVTIDRLAKTIALTDEVANNFLDSEIPERALFVKF